MVPRDDVRWRVMRPERLRLRRWGEHVVVYDDRSGDTHLLEGTAGRVLERLASGVAGRDELLALAGGAPSQHDEEQRVRRMVQLADVLQRLGRLGLVKPLRK
jgi:PqqD family protein of HPr-rel-A system